MFWKTIVARKFASFIANLDDYLWRKIWGTR